MNPRNAQNETAVPAVTRKTRNADLYLCRETQRKNEFPHPFDLQEECEDIYGWMPQYAKEIVEEAWKKLYTPVTAEELRAMRGPA